MDDRDAKQQLELHRMGDRPSSASDVFAQSFRNLDLLRDDADSDNDLRIEFLEDSCVIETPFRQADRSPNTALRRHTMSGWDLAEGEISESGASDRSRHSTLQGNDSPMEDIFSSMDEASCAEGTLSTALKAEIRATPHASSITSLECHPEGCKLLKSLLHSSDSSDQDTMWYDEFSSLIQGAYFRACVRPPCLQDKLVEARRFEFLLTQTACASAVMAALCLQLCGEAAMEALGATPAALERTVATAVLPVTLLAVADHLDILHVWAALAVLFRGMLRCWHHMQESGSNHDAVPEAMLVAVPALAAAAWIERTRHSRVSAATAAAREDREAYESVWKAVMEDEEESESVDRVRRLCAQYGHLPQAAQCTVVCSEKATDAPASAPSGAAVRVGSVDQLLQQAILLQPLLQKRVLHWARHAHGWLRASGGGFVEATALEDEQAAQQVAWAACKSFSRCTEKIAERYRFQAWRVCDVVRETIWFDSVQDLETCLMEVLWDRYAEVVGIKNAMDEASPSHSTGGFRFVKLQLRMASPSAKELGLDSHVSEVLLVLKRMEDAKAEGAHARFLRWRQERPSAVLQSLEPHRWTPSAWLVAAKRMLPVKQQSLHPSRSSSAREEELARVASQELATDEMLRRRAFRRPHNSGRGMPREVMLAECLETMKNYLWGANSGLLGSVERKANIDEATHSAAFASCFRMTNPIASVLCRAPAQAGLLIAGLVVLFFGACDTLSILHHSPSRGSHFRFTNLEPRDGSLPASACINALTVLHHGRRPPQRVKTVQESKQTLELQYEGEVDYDGWGFTTSADPACAPVRFTLESAAASEEWSVVGSSSWFKEVGQPFVFEHGRFHTPQQPGVAVELKVRDEPYTVLLPLGGLIVGLTMVVAATCGYLQRPQLGTTLVMQLVALNALPHLLALAPLLLSGQLKEALLVTSWIASTLVWLALVRQRAVLEAFMASGCISMVTTMVVRTQIGTSSLADVLDPVGLVYCVIGFGCKVLVLYNDWVCEQEYKKDMSLYHHVWDLICSDNTANGVLDKLHYCAQQANEEARGGDVIQRCVPWPRNFDADPTSLDPLWWSQCALSRSDELYRLSPATGSIDQLYAQAEVAAVVMRHKLRQWAVGAHGLFMRRQDKETKRRRWARAVELLSGEEADISWAELKTQGRALEKAFRCYGGEVARLLDLSRHSIVFEEMEHLLRCLELLRADPDVKLLRVKNDLHSSHHSPSGYRHVLVNLMIVTQDTQRMGVSTHVSELQLVPLGFALAKTDDGHRRYVKMRNARGE